MAKGRIVVVDVDRGIDQMVIEPVPVGDRAVLPLTVSLLAEPNTRQITAPYYQWCPSIRGCAAFRDRKTTAP
jgi:hypothetical protein